MVPFTLGESGTAPRGGLGNIKHRPGVHALPAHRRSTPPEVPHERRGHQPQRPRRPQPQARAPQNRPAQTRPRRLLGPTGRDRLPDALGHVAEAHRAHHPDADLTVLHRAYALAELSHRGQFRKSG